MGGVSRRAGHLSRFAQRPAFPKGSVGGGTGPGPRATVFGVSVLHPVEGQRGNDPKAYQLGKAIFVVGRFWTLNGPSDILLRFGSL